IYPGTNSVGRDPKNRIPLDYGDSSISRVGHAVIVVGRDAEDMKIVDGGKVNAVHVNSVMVRGERPIAIGDVIEIGLTVLRIEAV
ncbi:FHA domain-containing protein, partial [Mycobacterium tuberculosis]|nr:FHA domain-containing protein [Mycobacterium tuberculosis]MBP0651264.1 FHA domain-containing protein [Mycobacterium tuberculosis]